MPARHNERLARLDGGGDVAAFESFFRNHYRAVVRLAQSVVGDSQRAQDVAQVVFLAAYRRFPGDYVQAAGWVRVATVHTALTCFAGSGAGKDGRTYATSCVGCRAGRPQFSSCAMGG